MLARLGRDVFIVDQHAADEKTNFERLMKQVGVESCMHADMRARIHRPVRQMSLQTFVSSLVVEPIWQDAEGMHLLILMMML